MTVVRSAVRFAALIGASAMALTMAPAAQAGTAKAATCTLKVHPSPKGLVNLFYVCTTPLLDKPIQAHIMGDDPISDDYRGRSCLKDRAGTVRAGENMLNEDTPDGDEIYLRVFFEKPNGQRYTLRTNNVTGRWGGFGTFDAPHDDGC